LSLTHFETEEPILQPRRVQVQLAKRQRQIEIRRQAELAAARQAEAQIRSLTAHLEAEVANLDARVTADLAKATIKDPSHYAFSVSIKAMIARRDNLKSTIRALLERVPL
jgi:hypothetical protein